jgi:hypothetical protein
MKKILWLFVLFILFMTFCSETAIADDGVVTTIEEFQNVVRQNTLDHNDKFEVRCNEDFFQLAKTMSLDQLVYNGATDNYAELSISNCKVFKMDGSTDITLIIEYKNTLENEKYVEQKVSEIIEKTITADMSESEKVYTLYQYVVNYGTYDTTKTKRGAYVFLKERSALCSGYSMLLYKLLEAAGIENKIVDGIVTDSGEEHVWNIAKINGNWYHLDPTWDTIMPGKKEHTTLDFLMVNDDYMKETSHLWDDTLYPASEQALEETEADLILIIIKLWFVLASMISIRIFERVIKEISCYKKQADRIN